MVLIWRSLWVKYNFTKGAIKRLAFPAKRGKRNLIMALINSASLMQKLEKMDYKVAYVMKMMTGSSCARINGKRSKSFKLSHAMIEVAVQADL